MSQIKRVNHLPKLPLRSIDAHKGTYGKVCLVAGSEGMSGAACLAGFGALRSGSGLVTLIVPGSILGIVAGVEPSWLTKGVANDEEGRLDRAALHEINALMDGQTAAAIGPGLGQSKAIRRIVQHVYRNSSIPLLVDADGLNAFVGRVDRMSQHAAPRILTPHPGEFSRLTGTSIAEVQLNRESMAIQFAASHNVILVLKGRETVITDGSRVAVNQTGNSGMATGGTGDVLTGVITSLAGQGMDAFEAAQLGVHVHGLAGDIAAKHLGERSLIASDVHSFLAAAWQELTSLEI